MKILNFLKKEKQPKQIELSSKTIEALLKFIGNGNIVWDKNTPKENVKGYKENTVIYSIINYLSQCIASVEWKLYEVKDDKAKQDYKSMKLAPTHYKTKMFQLKAFEELEDKTHPLLTFFTKPNRYQGYSQFIKAFYSYKLATGNGYIEGVKQPYGANKDLFQEFYVLPSQSVQVIAGNHYQPVKAYKLDTVYDKTLEFAPETIFHSKYFNPDWENGQFVYGLSPIFAAQKPNKTMIEGYNAAVRGFVNNGAYGALTNDSEQIMLPEEITALEDAYKHRFSGGGDDSIDKSRIMFSGMKLRWIPFGISPVDLNIIQSNQWALQDICRAFNVPSVLFNDNSTSTYENMRTSKRMLWQNNILPALIELEDELNRWLTANYNEKFGTNLYLAPYLNNISELKEEFNTLIAALNLAKDMTPNERRQMLDLNRIEDPAMDVPDVLNIKEPQQSK